jgi:hypothetical protein
VTDAVLSDRVVCNWVRSLLAVAGNTSLSSQKAEGASELYVESNVWQAGGSTGWHTHPGHSWIIVTEGTVTGYEGDDPDCKPHVYPQGTGFVDPGGDHVDLLRNEDPVIVAKTIAVQLIPAAASSAAPKSVTV